MNSLKTLGSIVPKSAAEPVKPDTVRIGSAPAQSVHHAALVNETLTAEQCVLLEDDVNRDLAAVQAELEATAKLNDLEPAAWPKNTLEKLPA